MHQSCYDNKGRVTPIGWGLGREKVIPAVCGFTVALKKRLWKAKRPSQVNNRLQGPSPMNEERNLYRGTGGLRPGKQQHWKPGRLYV